MMLGVVTLLGSFGPGALDCEPLACGFSCVSLCFCWRPTRTARIKVITKKIIARVTVAFWSTFDVCAPNIWSVTPPPNAAPRPSCFGLCIKTMRTINKQTIAKIAVRLHIKKLIMGRGV